MFLQWGVGVDALSEAVEKARQKHGRPSRENVRSGAENTYVHDADQNACVSDMTVAGGRVSEESGMDDPNKRLSDLL